MPTILYQHHNSRDIGGADFCLFRLVAAVHRSGQYRCLVLLSVDGEIAGRYRQAGIPVIIKRLFRIEKSVRLLLFPFFAAYEIFYLRGLIKRENVAFVHTNDLFDFVGNWAARLSGIPSGQSVRAILSMNKIHNRLMARLCCLGADRLYCVSEAVRRQMFPACPEKAEVIYDWIDLEEMKAGGKGADLRGELGVPEGSRLVGCIGRIVPRKGVQLFLDAAETVAVRHANCHFLIIGDPGSDRRYMERLLAQREHSAVKPQIHFLPHRGDVPALMRQLDVVVNSSIHPDPFPGVVLEAMACGRIAVGADEGGMPEQIEDGVTGFLFKARDIGSLIFSIEKALAAVSDRSIRPGAIVKRVEREFSEERSVGKLMNSYNIGYQRSEGNR